jgi:predicted Zn-dependent protease
MGMAFCSMSGYDLNESVRLWKRMNEKNKNNAIPEFLSTHPSSVTRILQIRGWIPEIKAKFPYSL